MYSTYRLTVCTVEDDNTGDAAGSDDITMTLSRCRSSIDSYITTVMSLLGNPNIINSDMVDRMEKSLMHISTTVRDTFPMDMGDVWRSDDQATRMRTNIHLRMVDAKVRVPAILNRMLLYISDKPGVNGSMIMHIEYNNMVLKAVDILRRIIDAIDAYMILLTVKNNN